MGVAIFSGHGSEIEALVKAADIALYQAKHSGRNQVVIFSKESSQIALENSQHKVSK